MQALFQFVNYSVTSIWRQDVGSCKCIHFGQFEIHILKSLPKRKLQGNCKRGNMISELQKETPTCILVRCLHPDLEQPLFNTMTMEQLEIIINSVRQVTTQSPPIFGERDFTKCTARFDRSTGTDTESALGRVMGMLLRDLLYF